MPCRGAKAPTALNSQGAHDTPESQAAWPNAPHTHGLPARVAMAKLMFSDPHPAPSQRERRDKKLPRVIGAGRAGRSPGAGPQSKAEKSRATESLKRREALHALYSSMWNSVQLTRSRSNACSSSFASRSSYSTAFSS
jgi:hypothetical protein